MSDASDFFSGAGGGVGLFPAFPPCISWPVAETGNPPGFIGNGDYIRLNLGAGTYNLRYYNSAKTLIWDKVPSNISGLADRFMSFSLDTVDNKLWVVAVTVATKTIFLATIDSAGTVVLKGSFIATKTLSTTRDLWPANNTSASPIAPSLWRTSQGNGNFTLITDGTVFVINYLTGAKISEVNIAGLISGSVPMPNGKYFSLNTLSVSASGGTVASIQVPLVSGSAVDEIQIHTPKGVGLPFSDRATRDYQVGLQWDGKVYFRPAGKISQMNSVYDRTEFLENFDALLTNFRI